MSEGQQGFDRREGAVAAGGREIAERVGKLLEIGQGDLPERLSGPRLKALDVGPIGPLSVEGAAVEPDFEEIGVGGGLWGVWKVNQRPENSDFGAHFGQDMKEG